MLFHYPPYDLAYGLMFEKAMQKLKDGVNTANPSLSEVLEMHEISLFFDDRNVLPDSAKTELGNNSAQLPTLKKTVRVFFSKITDNRIMEDIRSLNDSFQYRCLYIDLLDYFGVTSRMSQATLESLVSERLIPLSYLLQKKGIVKTFGDSIHDMMMKESGSIALLTKQYDTKENRDSPYFFPPFSSQDVNSMILAFLSSDSPNPNTIRLLTLHKDDPKTYSITTKTRALLEEKQKKAMADAFAKGSTIGYRFQSIISSDQTEPIKYASEPSGFQITFSKAFLDDNLADLAVLTNLAYVFGLFDRQNRISGLYNEDLDSAIIRVFGQKHIDEYGSPSFFYLEDVHSSLFMTYYSYLQSKGILFEDILNRFVNEKIKELYGIDGFHIGVKKGDDPKADCEHLFDELEGFLKQYRVYVSEGELNASLFKATKNAIYLDEYPSLLANKYYSCTRSPEFREICFYLFSDQSMLSYIDEGLQENTFEELILKHSVKKSDFPDYDKPRIERLINLGIIYEDADGRLLAKDALEISMIKDLYRNRFFSFARLTPEDKTILEEFLRKGWVKADGKLFSEYESDYLSYFLNNRKFSNALALRNFYEHGNGYATSKEANERNYMTGLRVFFLILWKIRDDIEAKKRV